MVQTVERLYVHRSEGSDFLLYKNKDLTGQRFGNLTVINRNTDPIVGKKKYIKWNCLCDCGNMTTAKTEDLNSGKKISCVQCSRKRVGEKRVNKIIGHRYGHLTVDEIMPNYNNSGRTYYRCSCDCGATDVIKSHSTLICNSSEFTSCGCSRKEAAIAYKSEDVTGKRFGRLIAIKMRWEFSPIKVDCVCDCGNHITVSKADLKSGHTQSCGCLQSERAGESNYIDLNGYVSDCGVEAVCESHKNNHGVWIWNFKCPLCGSVFQALPANVKSGRIISCGCAISSKRELFIQDILEKNFIKYQTQYSFDDCKYKNKLRFDFAIFNDDNSLNCLIEYDGEQHYIPIDWFGGEEALRENQKRDEIKDDYCVRNNIHLYRLKYDLSDDEITEQVMNIIYPERLRQAV